VNANLFRVASNKLRVLYISLPQLQTTPSQPPHKHNHSSTITKNDFQYRRRALHQPKSISRHPMLDRDPRQRRPRLQGIPPRPPPPPSPSTILPSQLILSRTSTTPSSLPGISLRQPRRFLSGALKVLLVCSPSLMIGCRFVWLIRREQVSAAPSPKHHLNIRIKLMI
jgi:hypothetical protein